MKHDLYEMEYNTHVQEVLDTLRNKISRVAGVTIVGNRLTVRWTNEQTGELINVHAAILYVHDGVDRACKHCGEDIQPQDAQFHSSMSCCK